MQTKLHIKKGDTVRILAGESKGEEGVILAVDKAGNRAIVEGHNMVSKHTKPSAEHPQGGIIKKEAYIHVSNLMFLEGGKGGTPTRVGRKLDEKSKKLVRYSKKSGEVIK